MFPMTTAYPRRAERHQRPFNHLPAERSKERKRWGETHESLILDSCCMLNYSTTTIQVKAEEESINCIQSTGSATVWELDLVIALQWQLINMDPLLLICCLWPTSIPYNSIIAMTIMAPILIIPCQRERMRDSIWPVHYLYHALVNSLTHMRTLLYCGIDSQSSHLINIMFRHISTWLQWRSICGKERQ